MSEGVLFSRLLEGFIGCPVLKNVRERSTAKNYCLVSVLSVVSKVFEKLVNNTIAHQLEKFPAVFLVFSVNCRSSYSIS